MGIKEKVKLLETYNYQIELKISDQQGVFIMNLRGIDVAFIALAFVCHS